MQSPPPRRLRKPREPMILVAARGGDDGSWTAFMPDRPSPLRKLRVLRRLLLIVLWTLPCIPIQALFMALPGRINERFARLYWAVMCWIIGVGIRVVGTPAQQGGDGRPVVYVSTHSSWLDVPVLGARLQASFIAKEEIGQWPVVSWIAALGRTVYVRRKRTSTVRERDEMRQRLAAGDNLILFPEGTTSDGSRVLPFRSAFLSIAEVPVLADGRTALVQPVSLVYDRIAGMPAGRASRSLFAWVGDQDLASHFVRLAQARGMRATILLHPPIDPAAFNSRKALTEAVWRITAEGAAALRQSRALPCRPIQ